MTIQTQPVPTAPHTPVHRQFTDNIPARRRRSIHLSISSMKRRIAHLTGIDNRSMDTVEAIIACQREVIKAPSEGDKKTRREWIRPEAYTPFQVSLESIGGKMALRTAERESLRRSAGRRCSTLFNVIQPKIGRELVTRIAGQYNADNPQESEAHTYIDNLTPVADWAYQEFKAAIRRGRSEPMTQDQKRAKFEECASMAIDMLPEATPAEDTKKESHKMGAMEYSDHRIRQFESFIEATIDKLEDEYGDELTADMYAEEAVRIATRIWRSRAKINRARHAENQPLPSLPLVSSHDELAAIATGEEGGGSGCISGTILTPEDTHAAEGGVGHFVRTEADNSPDSNDLALHNSDNDILAWARRYIARGWRVVLNYGLTAEGSCTCQAGRDCPYAGKHPIGGTGKATADIRVVERKLRQHPRANLGIVTGEESGIVVLDFDKAEGRALFDEWKAKGYIDESLVQNTGGGGLHYPLRWFPGLSARVAGVPGLDIRSQNSQIVAAPSIHVSGRRYEWKKWGAPVAEASPEFKELLLSIAPKEESRKAGTKAAVEVVEAGEPLKGQHVYYKQYAEGHRNHSLFRVACGLRGQHGADYNAILGELRHRNNILQADKLPDAELVKIARSACKYRAEVTV